MERRFYYENVDVKILSFSLIAYWWPMCIPFGVDFSLHTIDPNACIFFLKTCNENSYCKKNYIHLMHSKEMPDPGMQFHSMNFTFYFATWSNQLNFNWMVPICQLICNSINKRDEEMQFNYGQDIFEQNKIECVNE